MSGRSTGPTITEFDLGCADCGCDLSPKEISAARIAPHVRGQITVAECPECGGRYYPDAALQRL